MDKYEHSKMKWVHINFWFKKVDLEHQDTEYLSPRELQLFKKILRKILKNKHIKRRFFLFEPTPHCFLAVETFCPRAFKKYEKIKSKIIKRIEVKISSDESNGENFLNMMDATTTFLLYRDKTKPPPWLREFSHTQGMAMHFLHCFMNQLTNSRLREIKIYRTMVHYYSTDFMNMMRIRLKRWTKKFF